MTKEAKRLKNFLRKHRCLNRFRRNIRRVPESIFCIGGPPYDRFCKKPTLSDAFVWELSPEGHEYWEKLDDMYLKSKQQEEMST